MEKPSKKGEGERKERGGKINENNDKKTSKKEEEEKRK